MVSTFVVRQKIDLRRTFYFHTPIAPEVRGFVNLFSIFACSAIRDDTIRLKWKTGNRVTNKTDLKSSLQRWNFNYIDFYQASSKIKCKFDRLLFHNKPLRAIYYRNCIGIN